VEECGQRGQDLGREPPKLLAVGEGQAAQHGFALRGHLDQDLPLVHLVPEPAQEPDRDHAVDQSDHGVVLQLQLPRQGPDGGEAVGRQPLDGQEKLVLPGPEPRRAGGVLAEREEAPDQVPEAREGRVVRVGRRKGGRGHTFRIYRNTI
jgi:hypothetical protein